MSRFLMSAKQIHSLQRRAFSLHHHQEFGPRSYRLHMATQAAVVAAPTDALVVKVDQMDKKSLRKHIHSVLSKLSEGEIRTQSSLVTRHCLQMSCVEQAKGVGIFLSRPQFEVSTENLVRELGKQGIRLFVPYMTDDKRMEMLELNAGEDVQVFERDKWGIPVIPSPELRRRAGPASMDIIFTPGVAFDLTGRRLGNGKGYYDRFFQDYDIQRVKLGLPIVQKYGLALDQMLLSHAHERARCHSGWYHYATRCVLLHALLRVIISVHDGVQKTATPP
jgi:5-formyltetrahydrofolate cyclo-ligase